MKAFSKRILSLLFVLLLLSAPALTSSNAAAAAGLNKTKIILVLGETYRLKLSGTKKTPTFKTSDKKVVSVTENGTVKGLKKGTATVSAVVGKKTYKCRVTVEAPKLSASKKTVTVGKSFTLKLSGTTKSVKWSSKNPKVATVSKSGVVRGIKKGKAEITAKVGGKSYTCVVTVKAASSSKSPQEEDDRLERVYITDTGKKFHRGNCSSLRESKYPISRTKALERGYTPCLRCNP